MGPGHLHSIGPPGDSSLYSYESHPSDGDLLGTGIVAFSHSSYPVSTPTPSFTLFSCLTLITKQSNIVHLFITLVHHTTPHLTHQEWIFCVLFTIVSPGPRTDNKPHTHLLPFDLMLNHFSHSRDTLQWSLRQAAHFPSSKTSSLLPLQLLPILWPPSTQQAFLGCSRPDSFSGLSGTPRAHPII